MSLRTYRAKRTFAATPEPRGKAARRKGSSFVIQKHAARRLHYDLRLELDGVMKSWAVTRGPSLVPGEKRLAVHVEDHPVEYNRFEGTIPEGQYGGGTVLIWDRGAWTPLDDPHAGLAKGRLDFTLDGKKLHGAWHLVRMRGRPGDKKENWLLIKGRDDAAREPGDPDILQEAPDSVVSGRSIEEIARNKRSRVWQSNRKPAAEVVGERSAMAKTSRRPRAKSAAHAARGEKKAARSAGKRASPRVPARARKAQGAKPSGEAVHLTHPDRVYWVDVGVTKQGLADYYGEVWDWMAPHVVGRPLALVRCPEGTKGQCFYQKHASGGVSKEHLRTVIDTNGREIIGIDDLDGLLSLVQAGVLEVHVRGSMIHRLDRCDRVIFDLDPGEGVTWAGIVAAAQEVRERLEAIDLASFVKLSGGKGVHVVLPIEPQDWDGVKDFTQAFAQAMAADAPQRYVARMTKSLRGGKVFVDYLRNSLEQLSVAAYSSRARAGAPVSMPVSWQELGRIASANQYTVANTMTRLRGLKRDPWGDIGRIKQKLPDLRSLSKRG